MSGSTRAITLKLSVQDADTVRQELLAMGQAGENALQRLDAAAQRAGGGAGGSGGGMGGFRNAVQQGGYQLQDFAVQVQGGTSALTALSQQGSQFLGIFGPAGAFAGAALTVGILAAKFLEIPPAIESATEATNRHREAMAASNELYENAIDKANRLTRARIGAAQAGLEERLTAERAALRDVNSQARGVTRSNLADEAERAATGGGDAPAISAAVAARLRQEALNRAQQAQEIADRIAELDAEMARIAALPTNQEQFGPNAPGGGGSSGNPSAEDLRRQLDQRYAIQRDYQINVDRLRDMARTGAMEAGVAANLEIEAARKRDDALRSLTRQPGGGSVRAQDRTAADPQGTLDAIRERERRSFEQIAAAVDPATAALQRYERQQESLARLMSLGIITEQEYSDTLERSTSAVKRQIDEIENRGRRVSDFGKEFGKSIGSAFEDAIIKGGKLSDVFKALEQDIARLIIRQAVTAPLSNAIAGATKGIDFGAIATSLFPGRADGGPVSMGTTYLVGERGPELFTPGASGNITPNHAMGGGQAITYAPTINVDARGSDANTLARARMEAQAISQATIAQFADSIQRGGGAARLVGRR